MRKLGEKRGVHTLRLVNVPPSLSTRGWIQITYDILICPKGTYLQASIDLCKQLRVCHGVVRGRGSDEPLVGEGDHLAEGGKGHCVVQLKGLCKFLCNGKVGGTRKIIALRLLEREQRCNLQHNKRDEKPRQRICSPKQGWEENKK